MPTEKEIGHQNNLEEARRNSRRERLEAMKKTREMLKIATPWSAASLAIYIDPFDMPFMGVALAVALFKDILDLIGAGSVPVIGFVLTIMVTSVVWLCLVIMGANKGQRSDYKKSRGFVRGFVRGSGKRYGLLFAGTIFEFLPFANIIPVETAVAGMAFLMILKERRENARAAQLAEA